MKRSFDLIYSIELSRGLCEQARKRFAKVDHVTIIHGDSGLELGNILKRINQPALFWLDGHYSGGGTAKGKKDTPIYEELDQILSVPVQGHVIIIDDARCFGKDPAYPSVEELTNFIRSKRPDAAIELRHDMIRVTPNP